MFTRLLQILLGHDLGFKITYSFGFSFQFLFILFFIKLIVFSLPLPSVSSHSLTSLTCCFSSHFLMLLFLYFFLKLRPLCPNLPFSPCTSSSARSVIDHHASSIDVNIFFLPHFSPNKNKINFSWTKPIWTDLGRSSFRTELFSDSSWLKTDVPFCPWFFPKLDRTGLCIPQTSINCFLFRSIGSLKVLINFGMWSFEVSQPWSQPHH